MRSRVVSHMIDQFAAQLFFDFALRKAASTRTWRWHWAQIWAYLQGFLLAMASKLFSHPPTGRIHLQVGTRLLALLARYSGWAKVLLLGGMCDVDCELMLFPPFDGL